MLDLRAAASKAHDANAARRMLALALVLEGVERKTSAETCGMDRQTLRDWAHRYNAEGLAGLLNRRSAGPSPLLNPDQKAALAQMVREGPDLGADGVARWRRVDLKRRIEARFGVAMHERTVGKQLAALGFRRLSVRPQHPKSDPEAQEAFKKTSLPREQTPCRSAPGASLWRSGFRSEPDRKTVRGTGFPANARVGQQGTLTRIRAERGTRPRAPHAIPATRGPAFFGAVRPERGATAALVMPHVDTEAMNAHLIETSRTVAEGAHAIFVLDGTGWHGSKAPRIPENITLLILDDLSYARKDQAETSVLIERISARYERRSIMITANQPFSGWDAVFPDKAMTVAAIDRLVHHATILEMNVESYRRRAALAAATSISDTVRDIDPVTASDTEKET